MVTLVNRAKVSTSTTGTGTITLGAALDGYQTFAEAGVTNGQSVRYVIEDGTNWEIGTGTYTATGTTLTRSVVESSNADAAINLSGQATVFITAAASDILQPGDNISELTNDAGYTTNTGTVTSVAATAGTGISISGSPITTSGTLTITNTAPDQTVVLTAGTGISTSGTYPNFTITNSAPDQTVVLTAGANVAITGTYPNFTIAALSNQTATTTSTTPTAIATYATASFDAAKVVVVADNGTDRSVSELLITWKSTTAYATEYAIINTGAAALASYAVDVSGGNFRIVATAASATSTSYTVKAITL